MASVAAAEVTAQRLDSAQLPKAKGVRWQMSPVDHHLLKTCPQCRVGGISFSFSPWAQPLPADVTQQPTAMQVLGHPARAALSAFFHGLSTLAFPSLLPLCSCISPAPYPAVCMSLAVTSMRKKSHDNSSVHFEAPSLTQHVFKCPHKRSANPVCFHSCSQVFQAGVLDGLKSLVN